jgi:hypothetical protein
LKKPTFHSGEIAPPPGVLHSADAREVLRCWIKDDSLHVSFSPGAFVGSAETWGMLLSDVGRHIAEAFEQEKWDTLTSAKSRMKEMFDAEWEKPSGVAKTEDLPKS